MGSIVAEKRRELKRQKLAKAIEIISKEPTLPKSIVAERVGISVHTLYTHLKARRLKYLCEK